MGKLALDRAEADWVEANHDVVSRAFAYYMERGEWPEIDALQRELDRSGSSSDVREALRHMPQLPGEQRLWEPRTVYIPLRLLRFLPAAQSVLDVCLAVVRRAVAAYQSDEDQPAVTSEDPEVFDAAGIARSEDFRANSPVEVVARRMLRVLRAGRLTSDSHPSPLGSGSYGDNHWRFDVNMQMARRFIGVDTLDEYFDRQAEILEEYAARVPKATATTRKRLTVFVLMPFGRNWSAAVYGLIRRAVARLVSDAVDIDVYRADDIVAPGKITDQITEAIETADALVADITGTNPNVMWELGYAQALAKPVVILNQDVADSPFDLRDWRQVPYDPAGTETDEGQIAKHLGRALDLATIDPPTR